MSKKPYHRLVCSSMRRAVYARDTCKCRYCDTQIMNKKDLTLDHIIPISKGGLSLPENLVVACDRCNTILADKVFETFEIRREWVQTQIEKDKEDE